MSNEKKRTNSIVGIDEAGRGAWAGPVAAWVFLFLTKQPKKLDFYELLADSKTLSEKQRESLYEKLEVARARGDIDFEVAFSGNSIIDQLWIREANRLAMQEALWALQKRHQAIMKDMLVKIDGRDNYRFDCISEDRTEFIVRGDSKIREIMGASIVAKVSRDRLMRDFDVQFPVYGFAKHKWYGTSVHEKAIRSIWECSIHRHSFAPMKNLRSPQDSI